MRMQAQGSGYRTQSPDTSIVAERIQFDCYRAMSPQEKLEIILGMCDAGRELSLSGLRLRHPDASDAELELREACLRLGRELARRVYGTRVDELAG